MRGSAIAPTVAFGGRSPVNAARAIGDRFVAWQGPAGRPDPRLSPFVTRALFFLPVNGHTPPHMAKARYTLFDHTSDEHYAPAAADRYAIFSFGYPRDPPSPWTDRLRNMRVERRLFDDLDEWLGMTAAALLAHDDVQRAGWLDETSVAELQPLVHKAQRWLLDNVTDEAIGNGGYRQITGRSSLRPAENCLWLLAWTVEALLRLSERNAPGAE